MQTSTKVADTSVQTTTPTRWLCRLGPWTWDGEVTPQTMPAIMDWAQQKTKFWEGWDDAFRDELAALFVHRLLVCQEGGRGWEEFQFGYMMRFFPEPDAPPEKSPLWSVFSIAEYEGVGRTEIVAEEKIPEYLCNMAEGMGWDGGENSIVERISVESNIVTAAMRLFSGQVRKGHGDGYAFKINVCGIDLHFQRLSSTIRSEYLGCDFLKLKNISA